MTDSSVEKVDRKQAKPKAKKFPLGIHKGTGYWVKKYKNKRYYFGRVTDDPKGEIALQLWAGVLAGREPGEATGELVVGDLCNLFLADKEGKRDNGELSPRTFLTYYGACADVVKAFGRERVVSTLTADDFRSLRVRLAKGRGLTALRNAITRVRSIFKFAFDEGKILAPVRYGQGFDKPKMERIDAAREERRAKYGELMFEAHEIRTMLATLKVKNNYGLRAMVLLAANGAFGQSDLANLPTRAVDLETGWVRYGRQKTGVHRKIPLWPETVDAVREWLKVRPKAKDPADGGYLFLTCRGAKFLRLNAKGHHTDGIGQEFQKLLDKLGLKRPRLGIYSLRHGFETIAGETGDQVAVDAIMGHKDRSMAAHYRERISDERLVRVVERVRAWVFDEAGAGTGTGTGSTV